MLKLHILQADYGDSLILEYGTAEAPRFLLVDGGPDEVYENSLRYVLEGIRDAGWSLELVVLSHVDEDHVMGLLDLFTHLQWQRTREEPETIAIAELWHNTFSRAYGEDTNARFNKLMRGTGPVRGYMAQSDRVSRSIAQGDELTKLAGKLGIGINQRFAPDSLITTDLVPDPILLGNLSLRIIGPTEENLTRLRKEWEKWLKKQEKRLRADDPRAVERAAMYADTSKPNRSSIMFLAEADGKSILFTGDGRGDHILDGLEQADLLDAGGRLHVDVLKLPHHGSYANVSAEFFEFVTADTYIISANGHHGHPNLETMQWLAEAAREQGRSIEILATNRPESVDEFVHTCDPADYTYGLSVMAEGAQEMVLDLASQAGSGPLLPIATGKSRSIVRGLPGRSPSKRRETMVKKALCVGINDYPYEGSDLNGCVNDALAWAELLVDHYDFAKADVKMLLDSEATRANILDGLMELLAGASAGDILVFTNSSHGTYVADFSGDEDKFDEALCPYDCADGLIIDDELRELFGNLPDDVHLTVISDSCFSGSVTRVAIGEMIPGVLLTPDDRRIRFLNPAVIAKAGELLENPWKAKRKRKEKYPESKMKDVLLSGCSDNEYSYDAFIQGKYHGAMTFHAIQAIAEAKYTLTYAQLGDRLTFLLDDAGYPQHPQVEGKLENKRRQLFT
jgi:beta-lactamase superfamily II metal-dependent hydrolase